MTAQYKDSLSLLMGPNLNLLPGFLGGQGIAKIAPVSKQIQKDADRNLNKLKDKLLHGLNETQVDLKACQNLNAHQVKELVLESVNPYPDLKNSHKKGKESIELVIQAKDLVVPKINDKLFNFFEKLAKKWPAAEMFLKGIEEHPPIEKARKIHDWLKENGEHLDFKVIDKAFIASLGSRENIPLEIFYLNLSSYVINYANLLGMEKVNRDGPLLEMLFKTGKHTLINNKPYLGSICGWLLHNRRETASKIIPISVIKECYLSRYCSQMSAEAHAFDNFKKEQIEEIFQHLSDNIHKPYAIYGIMGILNSKEIKNKGCNFKFTEDLNDRIYKHCKHSMDNAWDYLPPQLIIKRYVEEGKLAYSKADEALKKCSAQEIQAYFDTACQDFSNVLNRVLIDLILENHSDKLSASQLLRNLRVITGLNAKVAKTALIGIGTVSTLAMIDIVRGKYKGAAVTAVGGVCWFTQFARTQLNCPSAHVLKNFAKSLAYKGWRVFK